MDMKEYKKVLRKSRIMAREALSEEERIAFSEAISARVAGTEEYAEAETVFVYKWVKGEVRLDTLEEIARKDGKRLIYPLCISKTEMLAIEPGNGADAWASGYMGIMEPVLEKGTVIDPAEIDLIVAPCSSFDEKCRRLGMGGGFYDRYLPKCSNAKIIAVAFEVQKSDDIPTDENDFPVDAVATEERLVRANFH